MSNYLKKLWNDYGIASILFAIIIFYILWLLYKSLNGKGMTGLEKMSQNINKAYNKSDTPQPSNPLGQNETYSSVDSVNTSMPSSCTQPTIQNPAELLPNDTNSQWAQLNPSGKGDLANINLLNAGYHIGTTSQVNRNPNLQVRSEPANPQINVGPWNQTTIEPDFMRPPLELGQGGQ